MQKKEKTCGALFKEGIDRYAGNDSEKRKMFAIGFWYGQAEKVFLNACKAAMFRPSLERNPWALETLREIADHYGLVTVIIEYENMTELWITKPINRTEVEAIIDVSANSEAWHVRRGLLCGIPTNEIDPIFHLRQGYGKYSDDKD